MPRPISEMTKAAINTEIANYERLRKTELPRYSELIRARDQQGVLSLERSREYVLSAARARRFISYGELAEANGLDWATARRPMNAHLWDLIVWGDLNGYPLLSSIVVNKSHLQDGRMDDETLRGFISAADRLGRYDGTEPSAFLRAQQTALFDRAAPLLSRPFLWPQVSSGGSGRADSPPGLQVRATRRPGAPWR